MKTVWRFATLQSSSRWARIAAALLYAFGFLYAVVVMMAAHAHADPDSMDSQYLALLDRDGIASSSGATTKIAVAHQVCTSRMNGASESAVEQFVYTYSHLDASRSVSLVRDAEQVYCPGYLGASEGSNV